MRTTENDIRNAMLGSRRALLVFVSIFSLHLLATAPQQDASYRNAPIIIESQGDNFMTRDDVYDLCKKIAPQYGYDPIMLLAQIEQESSYHEDAARLEEGYYTKYVKPMNYTTTVEVLLSTSFGLGQLMGESLRELGYIVATDSVSVIKILDGYIGSPEDQVTTTCKWLKHNQGIGSSHTLDDALRRYNGSADYPPLVYARYTKLKGIYGNLLATTQQ